MFNRIKKVFRPKLTREDLIGKRVELSIGEPWDFKSTDGRARLLGVIRGISSSGVKRSWVYIKTTPFNVDQIEINQLVGRNRYVKEDALKDLLAGKKAYCNFFYKENGEQIDESHLAEDASDEHDKGWLIGGVKLID